jgi:hypothetical protein
VAISCTREIGLEHKIAWMTSSPGREHHPRGSQG